MKKKKKIAVRREWKVKPATRVMDDKKKYNRRQAKRAWRDALEQQ